MVRRFFLALVCAGGFVQILSDVAYAQIDEIVVTTTREPQMRIDNVGNITSLRITESLPLFAGGLLNQAPGVQIHLNSGQEHLTAIRSPVLVGGAGAGSFLFLEDGIAPRAPGFANVNALIDVATALTQRVEITRGPGSALYGSNAVHGIVNYVSAPLDAPADQFSLYYNSYAQHRLSFESTNTTATQKGNDIIVRYSASSSGEGDGYRQSSGFQHNKFRVQAGTTQGTTRFHFTAAGMQLDQETAGYIRGTDAYRGTRARTNPNPEAYRDAWSFRSTLRIEREGDNGKLTITPYFRINEMTFLLHFLPTTPVETNAHKSLGIQTRYDAQYDAVRTIYGIDIDYTQGKLRETQQGPVDRFNRYEQGIHYDYEVNALVIAPYVHVEYNINESTRLIAGLRFERTQYHYDNHTIGAAKQSLLYRPEDGDLDFNDLAPKLGIVHRFDNDTRLFFNLARAVRAPQTTDLYRLRQPDAVVPMPASVKSETLDSVELGYRGFTETARYEVALFAMRKRNHTFRDADDLYVTDGHTRHYGIEFDFDWQINLQWRLRGNASYATHRYAFDRIIARNAQLGETIQNGNIIDSAPRTRANLFLSYPITPNTQAELHWEHVGHYFTNAANTAKYEGHDLLHLTTIWRLAQRVRLNFHIDNIADTRYASRADHWFGNDRYFPGLPRSYGISIKVIF